MSFLKRLGLTAREVGELAREARLRHSLGCKARNWEREDENPAPFICTCDFFEKIVAFKKGKRT